MKRVEIIANQSIEEDLFDAFSRRDIVKDFTKIPSVHGSGNSTPKRGDHIWPEENFLLLIFCEEKESSMITEAVREVKEKFKGEGIKIFISNL